MAAAMDNPRDWSDEADVVQPVLERLSLPDFERCRSVCTTWCSLSIQCIPKPNRVPWLLVFPKERSRRRSCLLFNPEEDRIYTVSGLGLEFQNYRTRCVSSSGNWLLIMDGKYCNFFILNVFTLERIDLPALSSLQHPGALILREVGPPEYECVVGSASFTFHVFQCAIFGFLCVDTESRDYLVVLQFYYGGPDGVPFTAFCKSGLDGWRHVPALDRCMDMVYSHGKLYVHDHDYRIRIFDFSGDSPTDVTGHRFLDPVNAAEPDLILFTGEPDLIPEVGCGSYYYRRTKSLAITNSGDVLFIQGRRDEYKEHLFFRIYKINPEDSQLVAVDSLGHEALLFDLGVTVPADNARGIEENSVYFASGRTKVVYNAVDVCVYDLTTRKAKRFEKCADFSYNTARMARWIVPTSYSGR